MPLHLRMRPRAIGRTMLSAVTLAACSSPVAPPSVSGEYTLVSYGRLSVGDGPGRVRGTVRLQPSGRVERTFRYEAEDGVRTQQTLVGTYRVRGSVVELAFQEDTRVWRPAATVSGRVLEITYPSPADGPDIVERYARQ